jgi:hypothetical protein
MHLCLERRFSVSGQRGWQNRLGYDSEVLLLTALPYRLHLIVNGVETVPRRFPLGVFERCPHIGILPFTRLAK